MKRKLTAVFAALVFALSLFGCAPENPDNKPPSAGEVEFWSTYATEKILRDKTDIYESVKSDAAVNVEACRGEYESGQVIMTAKKAVNAYSAEIVGDLTAADGTVFKKENTEVRVQKYIQVKTAYSSYNNPPTGWYPDALVPMKTIADYGENKIAEGENQGLYITFNVPIDQKAGVYNGNLKVTYDGKEKLVPLSLNVHDVTVSPTTRSLSYFNLGFSQSQGELDATQNIWRTYSEELLKYRISPSIVMKKIDASDEGMARYVDEVYDLVANHDMSTINSPWKEGENLTRFLVMLAQKSVEKNVNLLAKTIVKGPDEPTPSKLNDVKKATDNFRKGVSDAVNKFDGLTGASAAFIRELKASANKIPHLITLTFQRNEQTDAAGIDTYCPLFNLYDTETPGELFADQTKGRWFYGCINPRPPYPTYHTEDTLASARAVSWMMSEYDVVGNLYWSATVYARYNGVSYQPIDDYFGGAADRFPNCNGDGYLFYPGTPYGSNKPFSSLRLEAIRDGNEEYELLYDLEEMYAEAGYSFKNVQRNISDLIYSGMKVRYDNISRDFDSARRAMISLYELAASPAEVMITDVVDDNRGTVTYSVSAKTGYTIYSGDKALVGTENGGRTEYTVTVKRDKAVNEINLSTTADGVKYEFDFNAGGKVVYHAANKLLNENNKFSALNATVSGEIEGDKIKLTVGAVEGKQQNIRYTSDVLKSVGDGDKKLVLFMENPSNEEIRLRLLVRLGNNSMNTELYSGTLEPNFSGAVEIDLGGTDIASGGGISYMDMYFSAQSGNHAEKTLYIGGLAIYGA